MTAIQSWHSQAPYHIFGHVVEILFPTPSAVQLGLSVTLSQLPRGSLLVWPAGPHAPLWVVCPTPLGLLPSPRHQPTPVGMFNPRL